MAIASSITTGSFCTTPAPRMATCGWLITGVANTLPISVVEGQGEVRHRADGNRVIDHHRLFLHDARAQDGHLRLVDNGRGEYAADLGGRRSGRGKTSSGWQSRHRSPPALFARRPRPGWPLAAG